MRGKGIAHGLANIVLDACGMAGNIADRITRNKATKPVLEFALIAPIFVSCLPVSAAMNIYYAYADYRNKKAYERTRDKQDV